ncbi:MULTISPECIES: protein tyrosine phosphatase family protein [Acaryochloris]|uniref:protein tyrosine phosphatase family protein n=1 Tax=Acaryochloris TaxID=155977 RepID=UPI00261A2390|nr:MULTISPECIES: protein tyrosine phosphatase family protein [Acaryochloris]
MNALTSINNFLPLSDQIATAGQPTETQFETIAKQGYQVVINLALPTSDHALPDEQETVESQGMDYINIPVIWEQPTIANLQRFFQVMDVNQTSKVFVHCAANKRVSAFMYLYRRLKGGADEATAQRDLNRIWQPNAIWQRFIQQAMAHHQP